MRTFSSNNNFIKILLTPTYSARQVHILEQSILFVKYTVCDEKVELNTGLSRDSGAPHNDSFYSVTHFPTTTAEADADYRDSKRNFRRALSTPAPSIYNVCESFLHHLIRNY